MNPIRRNYDFAGAFVMLSGLLHLPLGLLEGWTPRTKVFLVYGLVFLVMGLVLRKRYRWLAYVAYVLLLIGMLVTLVSMGTSNLGIWYWMIIMALQAIAVYKLFRILWAPKIPVK